MASAGGTESTGMLAVEVDRKTAAAAAISDGGTLATARWGEPPKIGLPPSFGWKDRIARTPFGINVDDPKPAGTPKASEGWRPFQETAPPVLPCGRLRD